MKSSKENPYKHQILDKQKHRWVKSDWQPFPTCPEGITPIDTPMHKYRITRDI